MLFSRLLSLLTSVSVTVILSACSNQLAAAEMPESKALLRETRESESFSGTIIDKETGKPIPNAVVVMKWPRVSRNPTAVNTRASVEIVETVTDAEGRYAIAGWVSKEKEEKFGAFSYLNTPMMLVYAPGYSSRLRYNTYRQDMLIWKGDVLYADLVPLEGAWRAGWDGEAIGLEPLHSEKWSEMQRQMHLSTVESAMAMRYLPRCQWSKLPNYYLARHRMVTKLKLSLNQVNRYGRAHTVLGDLLTEYRSDLERICGVDPKAFFLSHGLSNKEFDTCCVLGPTRNP